MTRRDRHLPSPLTMQRLAQLLSQAEHRLTRELSRVLEEGGSTVEEWRTLALLVDGGGHPMSEIAEFALLPAPTITRLIDRMVSANLAYRTADPRDRRRVLVRITPQGRDLHDRLRSRIEARQDAVLARAETDDVAQLAALLTQLLDRLD